MALTLDKWQLLDINRNKGHMLEMWHQYFTQLSTACGQAIKIISVFISKQICYTCLTNDLFFYVKFEYQGHNKFN